MNEIIVKFDSNSEKWKCYYGYRLISQKEFDSEEEAQKYLDSKPWEVITILAFGMAWEVINNIEEIKELNKTKSMN